jgi:hypothetical protein
MNAELIFPKKTTFDDLTTSQYFAKALEPEYHDRRFMIPEGAGGFNPLEKRLVSPAFWELVEKPETQMLCNRARLQSCRIKPIE